MSRLRHAALSTVFAVFALAASPAQAEQTLPPTPESQLFYTNLTVLRLNPLGFQNQFELDYRHRLYDPGDSILLAQNYVGVGISPIVTPGLVRLGVNAKVQPLAILKLEVKWEYLSYFGNFNYIQSYKDPTADYSDTGIEAGGEAGNNYATDGWQLTLDAELRARVGPIIVRSRFKAGYQEVALKNDDTLFHEPYFDLLLPREGWFFTNDLDLLVQVNPNLIIGVRHAMLATSYPASVYPGGVAVDDDNSPVHRVGPLIAYTFFDEPGESFNRPTILLLAGWYLQHRFRAGQDVSQAFPNIVLGFAFSGDLFDWRTKR
ncbi:MAG: hypothetical protein JNJ59_27000 [Deltaproteobacteria bacterium]|jgi:hypothetical protein|nr:hypothetical protein [Deltaproteobacteria bacterium]